MADTRDPQAVDSFGNEPLVSDVSDGQGERLTGTSWRSAFCLPLELPLFLNVDQKEVPTTEQWEDEKWAQRRTPAGP